MLVAYRHKRSIFSVYASASELHDRFGIHAIFHVGVEVRGFGCDEFEFRCDIICLVEWDGL